MATLATTVTKAAPPTSARTCQRRGGYAAHVKTSLALLCLLGCSVDGRVKPAAPDMTALVDAYAKPSRMFDEPAANEVKSLLETKLQALFDLEALADRLETVLGALEDDPMMAFTGGGRTPVDLAGEGYARIERICTGYGEPAPPVDKAANGYLELTVGYTEDGLDPVIAGGAVDCAEQVDSKRLRFAGSVNLYIGNALKVSALPTTPVLFQLAGFAFHVNDTELLSGGFDFQVCRGTASHCKPGFVEMLLGLPSGGTLVFFVDPETKAGGFRAANGIWTCAFSDGRCSDEQGNTITTPVYQL
jgi:hypothetical protein